MHYIITIFTLFTLHYLHTYLFTLVGKKGRQKNGKVQAGKLTRQYRNVLSSYVVSHCGCMYCVLLLLLCVWVCAWEGPSCRSLWYTPASIRGRLSEKERRREWDGGERRAEQCYLMDHFVINLLPQAVVVRCYSVKGVCISQAKKGLSGQGDHWFSRLGLPLSNMLLSFFC